ncbi:MAG: hypothetical protein WCP20_11740 [Desulfuromonadales bacterium]
MNILQTGYKSCTLTAFITATILTISLHATAAMAEEGQKLSQSFRFSAFGTLGLLHDDSSLYFQRDFGQPDTFHGGHYSLLADSLVGAQVDFKIRNGLDATVQMVAKGRAEQTIEENLEWAFLSWKPHEDFTLRAGRLGLDLYLLSDYRNVGFAYLWQRPVVEFYGPLMIQNFDGADASYSFKLGDGRLSAKLFGGTASRSLMLTKDGGTNHLDIASIFGARLLYEDEQFHLSAGYARATIGNNLETFSEIMAPLSSATPLWPQAADIAGNLASRNRIIHYYSVGASYEENNWVIQGEGGYLESGWPTLPDILSGYISVGYHFGDFTPYVVLATAKSQNTSKAEMTPPASTGDQSADDQLAALHEGAKLLSQGIRVDQQTLSLGLRWDIHQNLAVKCQWDLSRVAPQGSALWWGPTYQAYSDTKYVNLLSASLNFVY